MKIFRPGQRVYRIYFNQSTRACPSCGQNPREGIGTWTVLYALAIWSRKVEETEKIMGLPIVDYSFSAGTNWYSEKDVFPDTIQGRQKAYAACDSRNKRSR